MFRTRALLTRVARAVTPAIPVVAAAGTVWAFSGISTPCTAPLDDAELASSLAAGSIVEHRTKQRFPLHHATPDSIPTHLIGCNTRCMLGWCRIAMARAYAFGFYIDDDAVKWGFAQHQQTGARPTLSALLDAKQADSSTCTLSLVLVMARDIAGEHLAHGFRNSVLSRVTTANMSLPAAIALAAAAGDRAQALSSGKAAATPTSRVEGGTIGTPAPPPALPSSASTTGDGQPPALAQLVRFAAAFGGITFGVGEEIVFVWNKDDTCVAMYKGAPIPGAVLTDKSLSRALFDVYVGDKNAVSWRAKKTVEDNWGALITEPAILTTRPLASPVAISHDSRSVTAAASESTPISTWIQRFEGKASDASAKPATSSAAPTARVAPRVAVDVLERIVVSEHASRNK